MSLELQGLRGADYSVDDLLRLRYRAKQIRWKNPPSSRASSSGALRSKFRGRGMNFAESRLYLPGDDVRMIDWKVTARSTRTHTKIFEEEKERPVFVVADIGSQMRFGSRIAFKHVVVAEIAATLAWLAAEKGDRIGGLVGLDKTHVEVKPVVGRGGVTRLLRALDTKMPNQDVFQGSNLLSMLKRTQHVAHPGSLIFVISDFSDFNEDIQNLMSRLRQHNDLALIQVLDALELQLPPVGQYPLKHPDGVRTIDLSGKQNRVKLDAFLKQRRLRVEAFSKRHRCPSAVLSAGDDFVSRLHSILR